SARPRERGGVHSPDFGNRGPRGWIGDLPVSRQLIRLLSMLPPPLPVALAGHAAITAERPTNHPQREGEIDVGGSVPNPLGLLLRAAPGQHHHRRCATEEPRDLLERPLR